VGFTDQVMKHGFGHFKFTDDTITQGADNQNIFRVFAPHFFCA
jgi:hypothetical protein